MFKHIAGYKKQVFDIIEIGKPGINASRIYDIFNLLTIIINLTVSIMLTFDGLHAQHGSVLQLIESITVAFFAVDWLLRVWTAPCLHPKLSPCKACWRYLFSFNGIVDILSFLPYYLPFFFPSGAVAFRMFRVLRIFRLFRITAYFDSLTVIEEVIANKAPQLFSSVMIILILMLGSSLCMYSLEHEAQPDVFQNAFSGIWWSVSTLLTIGYGDIYPITTLGKAFSIVITFLGVGMVAIPTGIISAGFVDQYARIKRISEYAQEEDIRFIKVHLDEQDEWVGMSIRELRLPRDVLIAVIQRQGNTIVPRGDVILRMDDVIVLGAESYSDDQHINLKEIHLRQHHPWKGQFIRDLDISRKTIIVMVKRENRTLIPKGNLQLLEGDRIIMYTQTRMSNTMDLEI